MSQEEIERLMSGAAAAPAAQAPAAQAPPPGAPPQGYYPPPYGYYPPPPYYPPQQAAPAASKPDPKVIQTQTAQLPVLADGTRLTEEQSHNLDLIMGVPLEISV